MANTSPTPQHTPKVKTFTLRRGAYTNMHAAFTVRITQWLREQGLKPEDVETHTFGNLTLMQVMVCEKQKKEAQPTR